MRSIAAAVILAATSAVPAQAARWDWLTQYKKPNLHLGQLALHPFYRFSETYDSNIYLAPRDQNGFSVGRGVVGSWITKNHIALETELPISNRQNLKTGYGFESQMYSSEPSLNNATNQQAHVDYKYEGSRGMTFTAGDTYINTKDQAVSELTDRNQRWMNRVHAELDYQPENGRLAGGVDASHTTHKYIGPDVAKSLNRYETRAGGNIGYMVQPKTRAYVSYHRAVTHYTVHRAVADQDKNNKSHEFAGGVNGVLTPKLEGRVQAGTTYREYDEAPIGGATRLTRNLTVLTRLTYKPQTRTEVILSLTRGLQESVSGPNRFYISNNAIIDVRHHFPRKLSAGVNAAYGSDKYPDTQTVGVGTTGNRRDDIYQGGGWIEYDIQEWLSTGLAHVYRERNSTFTGQFNYQDHQTTWNVALKF